MLGAGVVGHQVHRDPDATAMRLGDELLERFESAEQRVDVPRVGDVIAVIGHGETLTGLSQIASTPSRLR